MGRADCGWVRSTQVVIALLSPHAVRRASDPNSTDNVDSVCLDELTFARFAAPPTPIVPVMAIPCEPPFPVFRLDYVSMTQWMHSDDEYHRGFERLAAGIDALHQLPAPTDGIRFVLIDALDEALSLGEGKLNIVSLLSTRLDRFPAWLRIVATTRREPDVLNKLSNLRAAAIDAHRQDNLDDIDRFIEARLQTPNLAERLAASRVPLAKVQHKLRDKADGNFLYVSQALQDIERDNCSFSSLDELPQGLNQWYEAWFERKFPNPKVDFVDARKVLEVILAAKEPLTLKLLQEITGLEPHYGLQGAIGALSPLLVEADSRNTFFHKSLADWLPKSNGHFRVSVAAGHDALIRYCMAELPRLRIQGDIPLHDRSGENGIGPVRYGNPTYAFSIDFHLSATGRWAEYERLLDDDWYFQRRFPLAYNIIPSNVVPDDWTVTLPASAYGCPLSVQYGMCIAMANRFSRLAQSVAVTCRFDLLPNGVAYCESLRDLDPEAFARYRDGCYTYVFYCFQLIAHLELASRLLGPTSEPC